jgi:hypothetical protein
MRIDVKVFVRWGCVSDIPLAGMDCVKYPDILCLIFYLMFHKSTNKNKVGYRTYQE